MSENTIPGRISSQNNHLIPRIPIWLWIGLVLALLPRFIIAWSPSQISTLYAVPDDAYYYFTIARNIVNGVGVTFDGLAPNNGFHPLWMTVITPLWWLFGSSTTLPVHIALSVGALFWTFTAVGVWYLAYFLTENAVISGLAALIYAWNPYNIFASVNGLETSLAAMIFVWSLVVYWRLRTSQRPSQKDVLLLGFLWAALILARTDYFIIILPCAVDILWQQRFSLRYIWMTAFGVLLWIPWLAWNFVTFGSIVQVSGKAYPYYLHTIWNAENHSLMDYLQVQAKMAYGIFANAARLTGLDKGILLLAAASILLLIIAWRQRKTASPSLPGNIRLTTLLGLFWPTLGAVALLLFHGLVRWMYRPWYFQPLSILSVIWIAVLLGWLAFKKRNWGLVIGILLIGFQLIQGLQVIANGGVNVRITGKIFEMMPGMIEDCERYGMIGVSDSGYAGYYLPCRVVNLDGVVNNQAFEAIQEGRFREYLDETGIQNVRLNAIIRDVVRIQEGEIPSAAPFSVAEP